MTWLVPLIMSVTALASAGAQAPVNLAEPKEPEPVASVADQSAQPRTPARDTTLFEHCRNLFERNVGEDRRFRSQGCSGLTRRYTSSPTGINQYFGGFEVGNVITLNVAGNGAGLYTELLSDNLWIGTGFGYARVGLGTLVGAKNDSTETTTDQFFQSGGNAILSATIPFMYWINMVGEAGRKKPVRRVDSFITLAVSADVPELNASVTRPATSFRVGPQINLVWNTDQERFRLFAQADGVAVIGSTGFFDNLSTDGDRPFGILAGKLAGGVDLNKMIRVGATVGWSTMKAVRQSPQLTVQLIP